MNISKKQRNLIISVVLLVIIVASYFVFVYDNFPYGDNTYEFSAKIYTVDTLDSIGKGEFSIRYHIKQGDEISRWHYEKLGKLSGTASIDYQFESKVHLDQDQSIYIELVEADLFKYTTYLSIKLSNIGSNGNFTQYERYFDGEPAGSYLTILWTQ